MGKEYSDELHQDVADAAAAVHAEELHTSPRVRELAAKGLSHPSSLTDAETAELCGSVMRHIERHETRR